MEVPELSRATSLPRALSSTIVEVGIRKPGEATQFSGGSTQYRKRRTTMQSRQLSNVTLERETWSAQRLQIAHVLESHVYELLLLVIVVTNAVTIILEVNAAAGGDDSTVLNVIGRLFLCFYTVEVATKLVVYRLDFFSNHWNDLDLTVVVLDASGFLLEMFLDGDTLPNLSVLRVLRLGRLARLLRIMNDVKELQMLVHSFISTLRTLFWACLMLLTLLTMWSIIAVELVHPVNDRLGWKDEECERCARAFRSVWDANLTFMQTIIAGDSWGLLSVPIIEEAPWTSIILVTAYISINLGVLNLVLTVIVNAAQEARESDENLQAHQRALDFEAHKARLMVLLRSIDEDRSGRISADEMHRAVNVVPEFRTVLEAIDIRRDDVEAFFNYLASDDAGGEVTYEDFVDQVFKMKSGDTTSLIMGLKNTLSKLQVSMREIRGELRELRGAAPSGKVESNVPQTVTSVPSPPLSKKDGLGSWVIDLDEFVPATLAKGAPSSVPSQVAPETDALLRVSHPEVPVEGSRKTRLSRSNDALQRLHSEVDKLYCDLHAELMGTVRQGPTESQKEPTSDPMGPDLKELRPPHLVGEGDFKSRFVSVGSNVAVLPCHSASVLPFKVEIDRTLAGLEQQQPVLSQLTEV
mmetsp:Transcript_27478/g.63530  ORF Transcript_27478/g.63530 Transcript_27478/m.63530 type:complete len:638 (+) Transcript_27478:44-1957(+)